MNSKDQKVNNNKEMINSKVLENKNSIPKQRKKIKSRVSMTFKEGQKIKNISENLLKNTNMNMKTINKISKNQSIENNILDDKKFSENRLVVFKTHKQVTKSEFNRSSEDSNNDDDDCFQCFSSSEKKPDNNINLKNEIINLKSNTNSENNLNKLKMKKISKTTEKDQKKKFGNKNQVLPEKNYFEDSFDGYKPIKKESKLHLKYLTSDMVSNEKETNLLFNKRMFRNIETKTYVLLHIYNN